MTSNKIKYARHVILPVIIYGIIVGVVVGSVVFFFKLVASWIYHQSEELYNIVVAQPVYIGLFFLALIILGLISYYLQRLIKSPIPQPIEGQQSVARYVLTFYWIRQLLAMVVSSFVSFMAGLPVGTEGPSVKLGSNIGMGIGSLPLSQYNWRGELRLAGGGAGFAVAANTPMSGLVYAMEESRRQISDIVIILALFACATAQVVSHLYGLWIGYDVGVLFNIDSIQCLTLSDIWTMPIIGLAVGGCACLYKFLAKFFRKMFTKSIISKAHPAIVNVTLFVMVGGLALVLFQYTGGDIIGNGHYLVEHIAHMNVVWHVLIVLLLIKIITIPLITTSGISGGAFIPMLTIGAIVGGIMGNIFVSMGMNTDVYATIVIISMVTFVGAIQRVPITAVVFMLESTWEFNNLLYVSVAMVVAVLLQCLVDTDPVQDILPQMKIN